MVQADPFAALLIERGARAYAGLAARRFLERCPELGERFAPDAFESWRMQLAGLLAELSAAVADGLPGRFAQRVIWTQQAFAARSVESAELLAGLETLREVLEEELPATAAPAFQACFDEAEGGLNALNGSGSSGMESALPTDEPVRSICIEYLATIGAGDPAGAERVVLDAVRKSGLGVQQVMAEVLAPVQVELGRLWHTGEAGVAEEHLASAVIRRAVHRLLDLAPEVLSNGRAVIVTVAAGDLHDLGTLLVAAAFELDGWRTLHLGADLPPEDLCDAVERFKVDLVALSVTIETQRRRAADAISALRAAGSSVPVLVGGAGFCGDEATWRNAGASGYASSAVDAVRQARALVGLPAVS